jgi:AcrR family transcriptional regulator
VSPRRAPARKNVAARRVRGRAPAPEGVAAARRAREQRRLESRAIEAADEVFERDGREAATLTEIARAARTSVKRLTDLFTSKERIFAAVLVEHVEALDDRIRRAVLRAGSARERLEAILWTRARVTDERRALNRLLLDETAPVGPEARRAFTRIAARTRAAFSEGIRTGELRKELGPEILAAMFEAAARVYLVERVLAREEAPAEEEAREVVTLLLDGFAVPASRARG